MSGELHDFTPPEPELVERIRVGINAVRARNGLAAERETDEAKQPETQAHER